MLPRRCTLARRRGLRAAIATLATLGTAAVVSTASGQTLRRLTGDADVRAKVRQGLPLAFVRRPGVATRRGSSLPAVSRAPVVITLKGGVQRGDLAALQGAGAILASPPVVVGDHVLARVTPSAMAAVSRLERVATLRLDGEPFGTAPPLFETVPEIHGLDAHRSQQPLGVDGRGVTVCNSDSGIDVLHPLFFRADGGYFAWRDVDADGRLSPGVDTVEVDGVDVPLGVLNGRVTSRLDGSALLNSEDTSFQALSDYVYADLNGNGQRDVGAAAGFDDTTPAFGEPIFVLDDVDGNGAVDPGEKLVRLATSKIAAVHSSGEVFRRGQNLIDVPRDEDISHGTGASGIIVGGHPGLGRLVGVAPGADVLMATRTNGDVGLLELAQWCVAEGASVMLHEYAPWQGHFLDGSEPLEQFIDDTSAQGVAHINPAGNLSGSRKSYKRALPAGMTSVIQIRVPSTPMRFFGTTLLWREPNRPVALTLETPSGDTVDVPPGDGLSLHEAEGIDVYVERSVSGRGTVKVDLFMFDTSNAAEVVPPGDYVMRVADGASATSSPLEIIGYVMDEVSGWGEGIHFPEDASEEHLIGFPGTADEGIPVAAYTGVGYFGGVSGARARYSGRGRRIDGVSIMSVSAPDDPVSAFFLPGAEATLSPFGGTSGASPHVAGVAALLKEKTPDATGRQVRDAIEAGAAVDDEVGDAPNGDWGYGKLRAYEAVFGTSPPGGEPPRADDVRVDAAVGVEQEITLPVSDPDDALADLTVEVDLDYDGTYDVVADDGVLVTTPTEEGLTVARIRVTDPSGRTGSALLRMAVSVDDDRAGSGDDDDDDDDRDSAGSGGCHIAVAGDPGGRPVGVVSLLLGFWALRRRRPRRPRNRGAA